MNHLEEEVAVVAEAAEVFQEQKETCLGNDDETPHFLLFLALVQPGWYPLAKMPK